jgi:hypothetical protein
VDNCHLFTHVGHYRRNGGQDQSSRQHILHVIADGEIFLAAKKNSIDWGGIVREICLRPLFSPSLDRWIFSVGDEISSALPPKSRNHLAVGDPSRTTWRPQLPVAALRGLLAFIMDIVTVPPLFNALFQWQ